MSDVHFCNLCDQSVPLVELQNGGALEVGDRVLCRECRALLGRSQPAARGGGGGWFLLLLVGLLGWGAAAMVWYDRKAAHEEAVGALETNLGSLQTDLATLRRRHGDAHEESRAQLDLLGSRIEGLSERLDGHAGGLGARLESLEASFTELEQYAAEQEDARQRIDQIETNVSVIEDRQRAARTSLEALRDEVGRVGESLRNSLAQAAAQEEPEDEGFPPAITALLRQLQDENDRVRYDALEKLQDTQDERLLPHVYPLLADPYEFTRFLAAHTLGDWNAKPGVPHLIEALLDEVSFVRKAAQDSLRRISGQNFGYDYQASPDDRQRGYQSWKTWWETNGADFLASS